MQRATETLRGGKRPALACPTADVENLRGGSQADLDNPRPPDNDLGMDEIRPLPALTQDEIRVGA